MKTLKTKRFKVLCILGLSALGVYLLHVYCQFTGNNHEPQRGRPAQETIGKICDISDLKSFGAPPHSGDAYPLDIDDWVDGTKSAKHDAFIKTLSNQEEIRQHYTAACKRLGFTLHQVDPENYEVACSKKKANGLDEVTFVERTRCEGQVCGISLELFP